MLYRSTAVRGLFVAGFIGALALGTIARRTRAPTPPNIVVLFADDAGWADFSLNGSEHFQTPRIDALAEQGVRFSAGYVAASICSPSRAALLTGRYPQRFGHETNPPVHGGPKAGLPLSEKLLPELLAPAGYRSAIIGKWHLGDHPSFHPNRRGFDFFSGFLRGERSYFPFSNKRSGAWEVNGERVDEDFGYVTDHIAAESVRFIDQGPEPFFLYVAFSAVHAPLDAAPSDLAHQPRFLGKHRRKLAAMTEALDRAVGTVLDALDTRGLDDTLVFFINDNGAGHKNHGSNKPWRGGKSRAYEGGVRVPFIARIPGVQPSVFDAPVSAIDVVPTVLAAAGLPIPSNLDGVDLHPYLNGTASGSPHDALYWKLGNTWGIRSGDLKLVHDRDDGFGLFDLSSDPSEATPLADHPDQARLQAAWDAWDAQNIPPAFESASERRKRNKKR